MKRNMFGALMTLIVAFTVAAPLVHARQTIMSANVRFAFSVGSNQLPAGAHEIREMDRATWIASKDGQEHLLGLYAYAGPSKADQTS